MWEYKRVKQDDFCILKQLHELGIDGWELVTIDASYYYYLKRPMKCSNCKFYENKITHVSKTGGVFRDILCVRNPARIVNVTEGYGCKHFEGKEQ